MSWGRGRFAKRADEVARAAEPPVMFETLEPRLLMNSSLVSGPTDPAPANGAATANTPLVPVIHAGLVHDTGVSPTDKVTSDDTVVGTITDSISRITNLRGGFDGASADDFLNLTSSLNSDGTFTLDSDLMDKIARHSGGGDRDDGGEDDGLTDGQHTLRLTAEDKAGHTSTLDFTFTLDTKRPAAPQFDLAAADVGRTLDEHQTDAAKVTLVGTTDPSVTVTLASQGLSTVSDDKGHFQFTDVDLAVGKNRLTAEATDLAGNTQDFTLKLMRVPQLPQGDAVVQWNQITLDAIQQAGLDPVMASRALAMESVAVLDTINAIDNTHGFLVQATAKADASADAAVAATAHEVLAALFPGQQATLDAQYQAALSQISDGNGNGGRHDHDGDHQHDGDGGHDHGGDGDHHGDDDDDDDGDDDGQSKSKADGIALGIAVADQVIALRANDGSQITGQFDGGTKPGQWQPTGPNFALAIRPEFANVTPFAMSSPDQFLSTVPPPPDLTSAAYATDVQQVQSLGSATSTARTADDTQIARFWSDGTGTLTEAGQWNQIAAQVAKNKGNSLADDARLFGELNVGLADAGISTWNAKYSVGFWSPVTAIHNADSTGNPQLHSDPNFTPLVGTPSDPEYVETQSAFSATAADVLTSFFGNEVSFTATSSAVQGATRSYTSFSAAAEEAGRSGILAGTDFQFSNVAGQNLGKNVGDFVVKAFDISKDTLPPKVLVDQPAKGLVTNTDPVITGHVLDNLSGVASLQVRLDNGALTNVSFDQNGKFSVPVNLPLDGSADGQHSLVFVATDAVGNASTPLTVSFALATKAPQVTLDGLQNGSTLAAGAMLQGSAAAQSGSTLTGLSYKFDNGTSMSVAFDTTTGAFKQALDLSRLTVGTHSLTVTATDNAGNTQVTNLSVSLPSLIPLTITSVNPANGAGTVGVTFRPIVQFSRAIDVTTLTGDDFFLTDSAGNKLAATIVPWNDNMHAWLFPAQGGAWPGGQTLTLHIDGSQIKALADGAALDAAGTGQTGSVFTESFTTVDTSPVANTTISGQIRDPGTQGNTQLGPDGNPIGTLPLQGVTVYILGHEDEAVQTDAQGNFVLNSTPTGDVKVVIDGRTANAPQGVSFPVLVVDLNVKPGQDNTIAGSRGSVASQLDNATNPVLILPRLKTDVMQTLSQTAPTVLRTTADSSIGLTPEQLQEMTLTVQPGTLIDENGKPLPPDAKVGFSVVPRDDIKDMLPPGLAQHSFDITIQAPGLSSFTTPAALTLPNVFALKPGTKTNLLTFDYTTGRLEIDGTGTVSADGKTVTTDPGSGVTKIGWHSMTPAGSPTGNNPTPPPCDPLQVIFDTLPTLIKDGAKCLTDLLGGAAGLLKVALDVANIVKQFNPLIDEWKALQAAQANGSPADAQQVKILVDSLNALLPVVKDTIGLLFKSPSSPFGVTLTAIRCGEAAVDFITATIDNLVANNCPPGLDLSGVKAIADKINAGIKEAQSILDSLESFNPESIVNLILTTISAAEKLIGPVVHSAVTSPTTAAATDPLADGLNNLLSIQQSLTSVASGFTALANLPPFDTQALTAAGDTVLNAEIGSPPNAPYAFTLSDGNVIQGRSDANGAILAFLPPNTAYQFTIADRRYNFVGFASGTTGPSGTRTVVDTVHYESFADLPDSNGDGLPDVVKAILGLNPKGPDGQIIPGMNDLAAFDQGLDATDKSLTTTTGIVASLPLLGEARSVALVGSINGSDQQTAYVATGSNGLAIIDASNPKNPTIISQLKLPGTATAVAVDANLHIAAVATGSGGLQLVDVEEKTAPKLVTTIPIDATAVKVVDGIAYVNDGSRVDAIDLSSGEELQTLDLSSSTGGSPIIGLATEGSMLYALDQNHVLYTIDISQAGMMATDASLQLPQFDLIGQRIDSTGKFLVGNGIAYVSSGVAGDGRGFATGFMTADVSNPFAPKFLQNSNSQSGIVGGAVALNGSGLGITVGQLPFTSGQPDLVDVMDTSDPTNNTKLVTSFFLPANPFDVAIGNGIAFVADGTAGLQVVNYKASDTQGVPPTLQVLSGPTSVNPAAPGLQLVEGQNASFNIKVTDDVQVRNVELLETTTDPATGQTTTSVLANQVSFPFDVSGQLPTLKQLDGATHVTLQIVAYDTGGNKTFSAPLDVTLVPDTIPPRIISQSVPDGGIVGSTLNSLSFDFSKPLEPTTVSASTFTVIGPDGKPVSPVSVKLRDDNQIVDVTFGAPLAVGAYQLRITAPNVTDRVGNALGTSVLNTHFSVGAFTDQWIASNGGRWDDPANWSAGRVPTATDSVFVGLPLGQRITLDGGDQTVASLVQTGGGTVALAAGSLTVTGQAQFGGLLDLGAGRFIANGDTSIASLSMSPNSTLTGTGTVTVTGPASITDGLMTGPGTTILRGTSTIQAAINNVGVALGDGRVLENQGLLNWNGGGIDLNANNDGNPAAGILRNDVGATLNANFGGTIFASNFGAPDDGSSALFDNLGTFTVAFDPTGLSRGLTVDTAFTNSGTVDVAQFVTVDLNNTGTQSGSFIGAGTVRFGGSNLAFTASSSISTAGALFAGNGTFAGTLTTHNLGAVEFDAGAIAITGGTVTGDGGLSLNGGTVSVDAKSTFTTTGLTEIDEGTLQVDADATMGRLTQFGGVLTGSGTVTVTGKTELLGGEMTGTGTTVSQAELDILGSGITIAGGRALENQGVANWTNGLIQFGFGGHHGGGGEADSVQRSAATPLDGVFRNDAGAVFNANVNPTAGASSGPSGPPTAGSIFTFGDPAASLFDNQGTFHQNGDAAVQIGVAFANEGTLGNGSVVLSGGGTSSGTIDVPADATLQFTADYVVAGGAVTGAGTVFVTAGTVSIEAPAQYNVAGKTEIDGGALQVDATATIGTLTQFDGLLSGTGTVTVTGLTTLEGGAMTGPGMTIAQGGLTIDGDGTALDDGRTLWNQGEANWRGGIVDLNPFDDGNPAAGTLLNTGDFNVLFEGSLIRAANYGDADNGASAKFDNRGAYCKSGTGPGNVSNIDAQFDNSGSFQTDSNTVRFNGGGVASGTFLVKDGATIQFASNYAISDGAVTGGGDLRVSDGMLVINSATTYGIDATLQIVGGTFDAGSNVTVSSLSQSDGILTGTGVVTVTGTTELAGGAMTGPGTTLAQGGLTIHGDGIGLDAGRVLENRGVANWMSGTIDLNPFDDGNPAAGIFRNDAGADFNVLFDGALIKTTDYGDGDNGASALFDNLGAYCKSEEINPPPNNPPPSSGPNVIEARFNNTGSFQTDDNTVMFEGGGIASGTFDVESGATVAFTADYSIIGGVVTGGGDVQVSNGTLAITSVAGYSIGATLDINGGTVAVGTNVTVSRLLQSSGFLTGTGTLTVTGTTDLQGGEMAGPGRTIAAGGLTIEGQGTTINGGWVLENEGVADWTNGNIVLGTSNTGVAVEGTIQNDVGAVFNADLSRVQSMSTLVNPAAAVLNNLGTFNQIGSVAPQIGVTFANPGTLSVDSGSLSLTGPVTDAGTISIASGAAILVAGDLAMQPTSVLDIALSAAGTGLLSVGGRARPAGALNVLQQAGFTPTVGQRFIFLKFGTVAGAFATVTGTTTSGGQTLSLDTSDTNDFALEIPTPAAAGAPVIAANLSGATDGLANDDTITGRVTDSAHQIVSLSGVFDGQSNSVDLTKQIKADGTFTLSPALLQTIAGGTLADGRHTLHLTAVDDAGNTTSFAVNFTLATAAPTLAAALIDDTGSSATDGVTRDDTIAGTVASSEDVVTKLSGGFDGASASSFVDLTKSLNADGSFKLSPALLQTIAGGTLADGRHTLHLAALDQAGNATSFAVSFTLETTAPTLRATLAHDTGSSATDGLTNDDTVTGKVADSVDGTPRLSGGIDGASASRFVDLTKQINADGTFTLSPALLASLAGGTLADGRHTLHLTALDQAGNTTSIAVNFTLETKAPTLRAGLAHDTGTSATDGLTNDDIISGKVTDSADGTPRLSGGFDGASASSFIDLTKQINADGTFTLSPALLRSLAGGTLADGRHTLHLIAVDQAGNTTTRDVNFNLDTDAPTLTAKLANGYDDTIKGKVSDPGDGIAKLVGGFDGASAANFIDLTALIRSDGTFVLDPRLLDEIARGGDGDDHDRDRDRDDHRSLGEGRHTLHLVAVDNAGNTTSFDVTFRVGDER